jgi:hypothetical protein
MRSFILFAFLSVSFAVAADEYPYLIPLTGYLSTGDGTYYYATTIVQNLSPRAATVRATAVYPLNASGTCTPGEPFVIPASERVTISPGSCFSSVSAVTIVSDEKLSVRTELDTHKTMVSGWDKQIIDAPTEWIAAGITAVSEAIIREDGPRQANLLLVNPSEQTLTMTIEMTRPEFGLSRTETIAVPALAARFVNLEEIRNPSPPPFIYSVDGRHLVRLTADGPWQGGISSIYKGPSMYVPAIPLQSPTTKAPLVRGPE